MTFGMLPFWCSTSKVNRYLPVDFTSMIPAAADTMKKSGFWAPTANTVFWIKLACQSAFGLLIIADSFYLIVCYITVDFFGVLGNPLFGWLRTCAFLAWIIHFPTLLGALLSIDI